MENGVARATPFSIYHAFLKPLLYGHHFSPINDQGIAKICWGLNPRPRYE
jgi:hypothetical protein